MGSCVSSDAKPGKNHSFNGINGTKHAIEPERPSSKDVGHASPSVANGGGGKLQGNKAADSTRTPAGGAGSQVVIALYTYNAKDDGDLSFRKGDRLVVVDGSDPDWWLAKHMGNNQKGYIPRNYVVSEALETEEYVSPRVRHRHHRARCLCVYERRSI